MALDPTSVVFTRSQLAARGVDDRALARALGARSLERARRGWYMVPGGPLPLREAVRFGARVSCVSALRWHGVWTRGSGLHLAVPRALHRPECAHTVHWVEAEPISPATLVESPELALRRWSSCGSPLDVVIAADSAMHLGLLSYRRVSDILGRTARTRRMLARVDGKAESGTETIVRLALRARGYGLRSQVKVPDVGRVDFIVGDRLVIEVDGREWHDTASSFEEDRIRDAALMARGFVVIRLSYQRVMSDLSSAMADIGAVTRRGEHLARARHVTIHG